MNNQEPTRSRHSDLTLKYTRGEILGMQHGSLGSTSVCVKPEKRPPALLRRRPVPWRSHQHRIFCVIFRFSSNRQRVEHEHPLRKTSASRNCRLTDPWGRCRKGCHSGHVGSNERCAVVFSVGVVSRLVWFSSTATSSSYVSLCVVPPSLTSAGLLSVGIINLV